MIPIEPVPSSMLSAHPIDMERNCFATWSPKSVRIGPTAVPTVLMKSVQSLNGFAEALGDGELVVFAVVFFFFFFGWHAHQSSRIEVCVYRYAGGAGKVGLPINWVLRSPITKFRANAQPQVRQPQAESSEDKDDESSSSPLGRSGHNPSLACRMLRKDATGAHAAPTMWVATNGEPDRTRSWHAIFLPGFSHMRFPDYADKIHWYGLIPSSQWMQFNGGVRTEVWSVKTLSCYDLFVAYLRENCCSYRSTRELICRMMKRE